MAFIARFNIPERTPPVKVYFHIGGTIAYSGHLSVLDHAKICLQKVLDKDPLRINGYAYLIAMMWGRSKDVISEKMIDLFGFGGVNNKTWPGNPDVYSWVVSNGVYVSEENITCGDSLIVLGKEEEHRRKTRSLEEFISTFPHMGNLEPFLDF